MYFETKYSSKSDMYFEMEGVHHYLILLELRFALREVIGRLKVLDI